MQKTYGPHWGNRKTANRRTYSSRGNFRPNSNGRNSVVSFEDKNGDGVLDLLRPEASQKVVQSANKHNPVSSNPNMVAGKGRRKTGRENQRFWKEPVRTATANESAAYEAIGVGAVIKSSKEKYHSTFENIQREKPLKQVAQDKETRVQASAEELARIAREQAFHFDQLVHAERLKGNLDELKMLFPIEYAQHEERRVHKRVDKFRSFLTDTKPEKPLSQKSINDKMSQLKLKKKDVPHDLLEILDSTLSAPEKNNEDSQAQQSTMPNDFTSALAPTVEKDEDLPDDLIKILSSGLDEITDADHLSDEVCAILQSDIEDLLSPNKTADAQKAPEDEVAADDTTKSIDTKATATQKPSVDGDIIELIDIVEEQQDTIAKKEPDISAFQVNLKTGKKEPIKMNGSSTKATATQKPSEDGDIIELIDIVEEQQNTIAKKTGHTPQEKSQNGQATATEKQTSTETTEPSANTYTRKGLFKRFLLSTVAPAAVGFGTKVILTKFAIGAAALTFPVATTLLAGAVAGLTSAVVADLATGSKMSGKAALTGGLIGAVSAGVFTGASELNAIYQAFSHQITSAASGAFLGGVFSSFSLMKQENAKQSLSKKIGKVLFRTGLGGVMGLVGATAAQAYYDYNTDTPALPSVQNETSEAHEAVNAENAEKPVVIEPIIEPIEAEKPISPQEAARPEVAPEQPQANEQPKVEEQAPPQAVEQNDKADVVKEAARQTPEQAPKETEQQPKNVAAPVEEGPKKEAAKSRNQYNPNAKIYSPYSENGKIFTTHNYLPQSLKDMGLALERIGHGKYQIYDTTLSCNQEPVAEPSKPTTASINNRTLRQSADYKP